MNLSFKKMSVNIYSCDYLRKDIGWLEAPKTTAFATYVDVHWLVLPWCGTWPLLWIFEQLFALCFFH